jgi:DNA ligase-3
MVECTGSNDNREALLSSEMANAIKLGLEGLVLKDIKSPYEPNARHWMKMKKDYLKGMADSADLIVLGAYFGTGSKGGLMSVFLMGVYDEQSKTYKTVCKAGTAM